MQGIGGVNAFSQGFRRTIRNGLERDSQRDFMITGTILYTWIFGELVGCDEAGNRYYRRRGGRTRRRANNGREQRWVMYEGEKEASRVPPGWYGWLHHTSDELPAEMPRQQPQWRKPHQPNLTGTPAAYHPPGHVSGGGKRAPATGDYEPWRPQ